MVGVSIARGGAFCVSALLSTAAAAVAVGAGVASAQSACEPLFPDAFYRGPIVETPSDVVFGDVDGDGDQDMVVTDEGLNDGFTFGDGIAGVYLNDGFGNFGPRTDYTMGFGTKAVALADIDGDGDLDMATVGAVLDEGDCEPGNPDCCDPDVDPECDPFLHGHRGPGGYINNEMSIRRNNGDGTFGAREVYATQEDPRDVEFGDFNGDGRPDVVATQYGFGVAVWINDGAGNMGVRTDLSVAFGARGVTTGDVNNDAIIDIVSCHEFSNDVQVVLGNGNGTFGPSSNLPVSGTRPSAVALGDLDGDGMPEIAVAIEGSDRVRYYTNDGMGGFGTNSSRLIGADPKDVAMEDIDDDGDLDILVTNSSVRSVNYIENDGTGDFGQREFFETGGVRKFDFADVNGDGLVDIGMANFVFNSGYTVRINTPDGIDADRDDYLVVSDPLAVDINDLDNDGDLDITTSRLSSQSPNIGVQFNNGDGTFAAPVFLTAGSIPQSSSGDVNGDGFADLVAFNLSSDSLSVFINNQAGGFASPVTYPTGDAPRVSVLVDLDGDMDLDAATNRSTGGQLVLHFNDGTGVFGPAVETAVSDFPISLAMGDLDGDGDPDAVMPKLNGNQVAILFNDGTGAFAPAVDYPTDPRPRDVAIGDLDGDGDMDIAICGENSGDPFVPYINLYFNSGMGVFSGFVSLGNGFGAEDIAIADADNDGDMDVLSANRGAAGYTIQWNQGGGASWVRQDFADGFGTRVVDVADIDDDGLADVVTGQASAFTTIHFGREDCGAVCLPDINGDGFLNTTDINLFVQAFLAQGSAADLNADGNWNATDINLFVQLFLAGC